jgi:hypothetical protein
MFPYKKDITNYACLELAKMTKKEKQLFILFVEKGYNFISIS